MSLLRVRTRREKLVIVGAGMAAARFVAELLAAAPDRFDITLIGDEPRLPYNRVLLSPVLAGDMELADIELEPAHWWRDAGVEIVTGRKVVSIEARAHRLRYENGETLGYDRLILATGSTAIRLPVEGANLPGVHAFRDARDAETLSRLADEGKRFAVIGGGLLGLEAAYGFARRGAKACVVHVMDRLMERQLDAAGAAVLQRLVEAKGVTVFTSADTARIGGRGRVESIAFRDGRTFDIDAVVFAVGVRPNTTLAQAAGLKVGRGIVVDDGLSTSDPDIFAIGECIEHRGVCYGLVEPAYQQARVLAKHLAGHDASYAGSVVATNLKVSGVRVFSAGDPIGEGAQAIICKDPRMGLYRKLVIADDRLTGAVLIGDASGAQDYLALIRSGESIASFRDELMFGAMRKVA